MEGVLYFPPRAGDPHHEVLEVPVEGIGQRREELVRHLRDVKGDASLWWSLAQACLRDSSLDDALVVLRAFYDAKTHAVVEDAPDEFSSVVTSFMTDLQLQALFQKEASDRKTELETIQKRLIHVVENGQKIQMPMLHLGLLHVMEGEMEKAEEQFSNAVRAREDNQRSLLPFVALGMTNFKKRDYTKALAYFVHVMKRLGSKRCPTEVRVAIGFCFFRMGRIDASTKIFKRCLPHLGAVYGLLSAYLKKYDIHSHHRRENFHKMVQLGMEVLKGDKIRQGDAFLAELFVLLARIALVQGEYPTALQLSGCAMHQARTDESLAQACLVHARSKHAMGDFTDALTHYSHALALKPDLVLARYGMSQMHIASGNLRNAATCLEQIVSLFLKEVSSQELAASRSVQHVPLQEGTPSRATLEHVGEAVRVLQVLSSRLPTASKERDWLQIFQQSTDEAVLKHSIPETFVAIGEMTEGRERMEAYKTALELYRRQTERTARHNAALEEFCASEGRAQAFETSSMEVTSIPLRVHNNAAVAFYQMSKEREADWQWCLQTASEHVKKALAIYNEEKPQLSKVTLLFNRARILEENHFLTQAAAIYKDIIKSTPQYLEAHVQLSAVCQKMGLLRLAVAQGMESAKTFPNSPVIQSILGALYLEMGDYQRSKEHLYAVLRGGHPSDVLALVLLGMLNYKTAPRDYLHSASKHRAREHLVKALENFYTALSVDTRCLYAAHGASAIIGEFGRCAEIPKLYESIVECSSRQHWTASPWSFVNPVNLPAAEVNLGHLWFAKRQFSHAIRLYEYALELHKNMNRPDPGILALVARSQYESRNRFHDAAICLRRLSHLRPWQKSIKFNLALVLQGYGVHFIFYFKVPEALPDNQPLKDLRSAVDSIDQALALYQSLENIPEDVLFIKHATIRDQIDICSDYKRRGEEALQNVAQMLASQEHQDRIDRERWEKHLKERQEQEHREKEEKQRKEAEREERDRRLARDKRHMQQHPTTVQMQDITEHVRKKPHHNPPNERSIPQLTGTFMDASSRYHAKTKHETLLSPQRDEGMQDPDLEDSVKEGKKESKHSLEQPNARRMTLLLDDEEDEDDEAM